MTIDIVHSKASLSFFDKNEHLLPRDECDVLLLKAIKKIYKLSIESIDIKAMKGEKNTYRIRKGTFRIIFKIDANGTLIVASVNDIDFRGNVYNK
jgi:mRNA-degrading endonuclease RelE of RelBE toxin-antitoxin system